MQELYLIVIVGIHASMFKYKKVTMHELELGHSIISLLEAKLMCELSHSQQ